MEHVSAPLSPTLHHIPDVIPYTPGSYWCFLGNLVMSNPNHLLSGTCHINLIGNDYHNYSIILTTVTSKRNNLRSSCSFRTTVVVWTLRQFSSRARVNSNCLYFNTYLVPALISYGAVPAHTHDGSQDHTLPPLLGRKYKVNWALHPNYPFQA